MNEVKLLEAKKVFENTIKTFRNYKSCVSEKEYKVRFSDASFLTFRFNNSNICHLLGIDFEKTRDLLVKHEYIDDYNITSYEVLEFLCENIYVMLNIYNHLDKELFSLHKMNSKADSLKKFFNIEKLQFFRIHRLSEIVGYTGRLKSDNFLVLEDNESLHMLGISKNESGNYIETVFSASNNQKFLNKQKITFPLQVETDGKYYDAYHKPINIINQERKYYTMFALYNKCYFDDSYSPIFLKKSKEKLKHKKLMLEKAK